jgi:hypothetical protein
MTARQWAELLIGVALGVFSTALAQAAGLA